MEKLKLKRSVAKGLLEEHLRIHGLSNAELDATTEGMLTALEPLLRGVDLNSQEEFRKKRVELGGLAARKWLAEELRKLADHLEEGPPYPGVYGAHVPVGGVNYEGTMEAYEIILSHPWGG